MARLNEANVVYAKEIIGRYPKARSATIPLLHLAQQQDGYVTNEAMKHIGELVGATSAEILGTATFYEMFKFEPVGKYLINICATLSCALLGAERVTEELSAKLGIKPGETDSTGTFTLMEVECLGACDRAPALMVNDAWHECLQPEAASKMVDDLRARGEAALSGCVHVVERGKR